MIAAAYTPTARVLHWVTAVAVLAMLPLGLWMTGLPLGFAKLYAYAWHKWIGLAVLLLTAGRLLWRWRHPPPPLPSGTPPWQRRAAAASHGALLVLLLVLPFSGWLMSSAGGVTVYWFGYLPLPDLVARDLALFKTLKAVHVVLSRLLMALVALHLAAVLYHGLVRGDGVLRRMWPRSG